MDWGKIYRIIHGITNETLTEAEEIYLAEIGEKYSYRLPFTYESTEYINLFQMFLREQLNVETVVEVLAVIVLAVVGLVFMWWGVRKITTALMKAFRKGKISL